MQQKKSLHRYHSVVVVLNVFADAFNVCCDFDVCCYYYLANPQSQNWQLHFDPPPH